MVLCKVKRPFWWAHLNVWELKFSDLPQGVNLTLPPVSNFHNNFTDLIGLSFLFIETKELCEARAKLEMSSHFQIYPWGDKSDPPVSNFHDNFTDLIVSIYRNERALWSKSKTWNELTFSDLPPGGRTDGPSLPPIQNCQSTEWTLHCSMLPMRAHLKWSSYKKM